MPVAIANLDAASREIAERMLTSHAYRERLAIDRFKSVLDLAPSPEDRAHLQQAIEEEARHYAGCLEVAEWYGIELVPRVKARMARTPHGIPEFHNWLDLLLAQALNDAAGAFVLRGVIGGTLTRYAELCAATIADEENHCRVGRLGAIAFWSSQVGVTVPTEQAEHQLMVHLIAAIKSCGRARSITDDAALQLGLKSRSSTETLDGFLAYARLFVHALGLDADDWLRRAQQLAESH